MRYYILRIAFSFIFIQGICFSQQKLQYKQLLKQYSEAEKYYEKAIQLGLKKNADENEELKYNQIALNKFSVLNKQLTQDPLTDSIRFFTLLKIADLQYYFDSLTKALRNYQLAISTGTKLSSLPDSLLFKPYLFSGNIEFQNNQLDAAQASFKQAELIQKRYPKTLQESERLFNALGVLYYQSGNYKQSKNYFRKASEILPKNHPYYKNLFVNYRINFATALFKLENYDSAYNILIQLLPYKQHLNEIYNNIGLIEFYLTKPYKAIEDFQNVHYTDKLKVGLFNDMANAWLSLGKFDSAALYLNKAFKANTEFNGNSSSIDHGLSFKIQADLQLQIHEPIKALNNYQSAIHQFYTAFTNTSIFKNPSWYSGAFSYINLFKALSGKAEGFHYMYLHTGQLPWAISELNVYESVFYLFDYIERIYDSDEARLFLEKSKYLIQQKPIDIAFELYKKTNKKAFLEKAYELDEKAKASVLVFNEQQNISGVNSIGQHDNVQQLKEEITRLSLKAGLLTDPVMLKTINNQISDKEIALGKILEEWSKTNPLAYYTIPSLSYLQNQFLDDHTILITCHLAENKLTQFIITRNSFTGIQKNTYPRFKSDLQQTISNWQRADAYKNTEEGNKRLYRFLLGDVNLESNKGIIIVPDNELNYLPFEALKKNDHYLIEDHPVQYQYSTVLLKKETQDLRNLETLSFAPFTKKGYAFEDLNFKKLSFSSQEISQNKGSYFTDTQATKNKFISLIGKYEIIHLATHASSNTGNNQLSYIAFAPWGDTTRENFLLFAPEIYNLSLKRNRLIILSACETSSGYLIKGEGVMSLSRAFEYSGCQNIISSLWEADDEATSIITQKFHNYLNKGKSIAQALQIAKKDYLSDPRINPRRKTPAYWAHLIYIGNYQPSSFNITLIWIIILIAFAITILISMKAFRNRVARKKG